jgi:hypothetical protein
VHLDECETAASAGFPVGDNLRTQYSTELGKRLHQFITGGFEGNVSYVQLLTHSHPHKLAKAARTNEYRRRTSASAVQGQTRFNRQCYLALGHSIEKWKR